MNTTTRRHPRTLQEAFGPYTSSSIDNQTPVHWADKVVALLAIVTIGGWALHQVVVVVARWLGA